MIKHPRPPFSRTIVFTLAITFSRLAVGQTPAPSPTPTAEELAWQAKMDANHKAFDDAVAAWRAEKGKPGEAAAWQTARQAADRLRNRFDGSMEKCEAIIEEVALGAPKAEKEIKFAGAAQPVPIKTLHSIPFTVVDHYGDKRDWVLRRINAGSLEAWTPNEGWLFDAHGKVLNHAVVKRKDGTGLQWFGAFLPDGRWVTTDILERDDTLYLFSREGKLLKELSTGAMVPAEGASKRKTKGLIAWARQDAAGTGLVLKLGDSPNGWSSKQVVRIDADFKPHAIGVLDPWKLCGPRKLGARYGNVLSDDGSLIFTCSTPGHGGDSGHYTYATQTARPEAQYIFGDGEGGVGSHAFWWDASRVTGFWPASHATYAEVGRKEPRETWFFRENGDAAGWVAAAWIGDAADGKAMLFRAEDKSVLTIAPDLKAAARRAFTDAAGAAAKPVALYDDLGLGFFEDGTQLALAGWK